MRKNRQRQLVPLEFAPGVVKDATADTPRGFWTDTQWVRFRVVGGRSFVENMGGWTRMTPSTVSGKTRALHRWTSLTGDTITAIGSSDRYVIWDNIEMFDVTPYRSTVSGLTNPFATTAGSAVITVTTAAPHGARVNDEIVISGSGDVGGILAANINGLRTILAINSDTQFTFTAGAAASLTTTGGSTATINFVLSKGEEGSPLGAGWGVAPYGTGDWGVPASVTGLGRLQVWTHDNFGEDLVACRRGDGIYYLDFSALPNRMVNITALPGAADCPTLCDIVAVSERDRHVIAFGTVPFGGGAKDPLLVRWSDQENAAVWTPSSTTTSGEIRLSRGIQIICVKQTRQEILIWTDNAIYSMRYQGGVDVFGIDMLAEGTDIAGTNAAVNFNDTVYWLGRGGFFMYNGSIRPLECPIRNWLEERIDWDQREKIYAGTIRQENEIIWLYPSVDGDGECDSYVVYNTLLNCWYTGTLTRTAWWDGSVGTYPVGAAIDGYLYEHESGWVNNETVPPTAIPSHAQSSYVELGDGQDVLFADELIPDLSFKSTSVASPNVSMTLSVRDWPGEPDHDTEQKTIARTATVPVEQFTAKRSIRLRGRAASLRISSTQSEVSWRMGVPRLRVRPDGERV